MLLQAPDSIVTLLGVSGGKDEGETLECWPRKNEFINQPAAYGETQAAVPLSDQKRT